MDIEPATISSAPVRVVVLAVTVWALLAGAAPAAPAPKIVIPDVLKRSAMACLAEALRLCPDALSAKDHGVSCIVGKRRLLSRPCQGVYDQGLRLLNGQDIHITLRPRGVRPGSHRPAAGKRDCAPPLMQRHLTPAERGSLELV